MKKRKRSKKPIAFAAALLVVACIAVIAGLALSGDGSGTPKEKKDFPQQSAAVSFEAPVATAPPVDAFETVPAQTPEISYCRATLYDENGNEIASRDVFDSDEMTLISELADKINVTADADSPMELADIISGNCGRVEIVYARGKDTHIALVYDLNGSCFQTGAMRVFISRDDCNSVFALFEEKQEEIEDTATETEPEYLG